MKFLLITAGCAECWSSTKSDPLIQAQVYDTFEEAKAASWLKDYEWEEHFQGGWFAASGQGDDWIFEVPDGVQLKARPK